MVAVGVQTSFWYSAKSVTEKNNSRVDCAEATKKTVQAMRNEWWGFLAAGDCLAELHVMKYQAKPDRFKIVRHCRTIYFFNIASQ